MLLNDTCPQWDDITHIHSIVKHGDMDNSKSNIFGDTVVEG